MKYAVAADRKADMNSIANGLFETEVQGQGELSTNLAKGIRIAGAICLGIYMGIFMSGLYNALV